MPEGISLPNLEQLGASWSASSDPETRKRRMAQNVLQLVQEQVRCIVLDSVLLQRALGCRSRCAR